MKRKSAGRRRGLILSLLLLLSIIPISLFIPIPSVRAANDVHNNGDVRFEVSDRCVITKIENLHTVEGEAMYLYPNVYYRDAEDRTLYNFGLNVIDAWAKAYTVGAFGTRSTLTKVYTDANSVQHNMTFTVTLPSSGEEAEIVFQDVTDVPTNLMSLFLEGDPYPQGYALQNVSGRMDVGSNDTYTNPLPYDWSMWVFGTGGGITSGSTSIGTDYNLKPYVVCWADGNETSVGLYAHYVDFLKIRVRSKPTVEGQFFGLDVTVRYLTDKQCTTTIYFGAWNDNSPASCAAAYGALDLVGPIAGSLPAADKFKLVRLDLNYNLYDFVPLYQEFLENLTIYDGNATLITAGSTSAIFFKWEGHADSWNRIMVDTGVDFVQLGIDMAKSEGHLVMVEIDPLDAIWNAKNPATRAVDYLGSVFNTTSTELHSQHYPIYGIAKPVHDLQDNVTAGANVVIQLDAAAFANVKWEVGETVQIISDVTGENTTIITVDDVNYRITADLTNSYNTLNNSYALIMWYVSYDKGVTWLSDESTDANGLSYYWIRILNATQAGATYHDRFIDFCTYLCENYDFHALVFSESMYKAVDYCAAAKARFMADTGEADWPRKTALSIFGIKHWDYGRQKYLMICVMNFT